MKPHHFGCKHENHIDGTGNEEFVLTSQSLEIVVLCEVCKVEFKTDVTPTNAAYQPANAFYVWTIRLVKISIIMVEEAYGLVTLLKFVCLSVGGNAQRLPPTAPRDISKLKQNAFL